jgi:hypothetical protein
MHNAYQIGVKFGCRAMIVILFGNIIFVSREHGLAL